MEDARDAKSMLEVESEYQCVTRLFAVIESCGGREQRSLMRADLSCRSSEIAQETAAVVERAAHVTMLSALDLDAAGAGGAAKTYRRVLRSVGSYYMMAGPVSIERTLYQVAGKRNV